MKDFKTRIVAYFVIVAYIVIGLAPIKTMIYSKSDI